MAPAPYRMQHLWANGVSHCGTRVPIQDKTQIVRWLSGHLAWELHRLRHKAGPNAEWNVESATDSDNTSNAIQMQFTNQFEFASHFSLLNWVITHIRLRLRCHRCWSNQNSNKMLIVAPNNHCHYVPLTRAGGWSLLRRFITVISACFRKVLGYLGSTSADGGIPRAWYLCWWIKVWSSDQPDLDESNFSDDSYFIHQSPSRSHSADSNSFKNLSTSHSIHF